MPPKPKQGNTTTPKKSSQRLAGKQKASASTSRAHQATRSSARLTNVVSEPTAMQGPPTIMEAIPENLKEPQFNTPGSPPVASEQVPPSPAQSPPASVSIATEEPPKDNLDDVNWEEVMVEAGRAHDFEVQAQLMQQDFTSQEGSDGVDKQSSEVDDPYEELEDSFIDQEPVLPKKTKVPSAPSAKAKGGTGGRKAAKIVSQKDIAKEMGDFDIEALLVVKPFREKVKLSSGDDFFDARDKIAEVLNRRSQDLELGYTCSWWTVAEKSIPNSLRNAECWEGLIEDIKIWLIGDKQRPGSKWSITVVDKEDIAASGKGGKETKEKKAPAKPVQPDSPPPDRQLTAYSELKKRRMCEACSKACWVIPPSYADAGQHVPLGDNTLQMWADAICTSSSGASYVTPGKELADEILEARAEKIKMKEMLKRRNKARQSIIRAQKTPSRYGRHEPNEGASPSPEPPAPGSFGLKRSAQAAGLDVGSSIPMQLYQWFKSLDRTPQRRMEDFNFAALYEKFEAEGIDTLEVFNELGKDELIKAFGLSLGVAIKLAKWAKDDVAGM